MKNVIVQYDKISDKILMHDKNFLHFWMTVIEQEDFHIEKFYECVYRDETFRLRLLLNVSLGLAKCESVSIREPRAQ